MEGYSILWMGVQQAKIQSIRLARTMLTLLKIAISEESFEMDPYSTESVHNAAHQIIYKNIYQKFEDIRLHRVSFEDEKVNLYRTAINKYSSELSEDK